MISGIISSCKQQRGRELSDRFTQESGASKVRKTFYRRVSHPRHPRWHLSEPPSGGWDEIWMFGQFTVVVIYWRRGGFLPACVSTFQQSTAAVKVINMGLHDHKQPKHQNPVVKLLLHRQNFPCLSVIKPKVSQSETLRWCSMWPRLVFVLCRSRMRLGHWHRANMTRHSAAESLGQVGNNRRIKGSSTRERQSMAEHDEGKQRANICG